MMSPEEFEKHRDTGWYPPHIVIDLQDQATGLYSPAEYILRKFYEEVEEQKFLWWKWKHVYKVAEPWKETRMRTLLTAKEKGFDLHNLRFVIHYFDSDGNGNFWEEGTIIFRNGRWL